jgi:hypothetical protein
MTEYTKARKSIVRCMISKKVTMRTAATRAMMRKKEIPKPVAVPTMSIVRYVFSKLLRALSEAMLILKTRSAQRSVSAALEEAVEATEEGRLLRSGTRPCTHVSATSAIVTESITQNQNSTSR